MRNLIIALSLAVCLVPNTGIADQEPNCWAQWIAIEELEFPTPEVGNGSVTVKVTNNAPIPLSAVEVVFELWSDTRPLYLYTSWFPDLRSIEGGLVTGETIEVSNQTRMKDRELGFAQEAGELTLRTRVEWVEDVTGQRRSC